MAEQTPHRERRADGPRSRDDGGVGTPRSRSSEPGAPDSEASRSGAPESGPADLIAAALLVALAVVFLLLTAWPSNPVTRRLTVLPGIAQVIAFPRPLGLAGLLVFGPLTALTLRACLRRGFRGFRAGAAAALALLLVASLVPAIWPGTPPWDAGPRASAATGTAGRELRLVSFNSADSLAPEDLAELVRRYDPDVLVLPETAPADLKDAQAATQITGTVFTTAGVEDHFADGTAPTSILVRDRPNAPEGLGAYRQADAAQIRYGAVRLENPDGRLPRLVGVHTAPPVTGQMPEWQRDVATLLSTYDAAPAQGPLIMAGDFNTTLRHGGLAARTRLADAAEACGLGGVGTWPSGKPRELGTTIDHVLLTTDIQVASCDLAQLKASDHRALAVTLRLP